MKTNNPVNKPNPKYQDKQSIFYINYLIDPESFGTYKVRIDQGVIDHKVYVMGDWYYSVKTSRSFNQLPQPACTCKFVYDIPEHLIFTNEDDALQYFGILTKQLDFIIHEGIQLPFNLDEFNQEDPQNEKHT